MGTSRSVIFGLVHHFLRANVRDTPSREAIQLGSLDYYTMSTQTYLWLYIWCARHIRYIPIHKSYIAWVSYYYCLQSPWRSFLILFSCVWFYPPAFFFNPAFTVFLKISVFIQSICLNPKAVLLSASLFLPSLVSAQLDVGYPLGPLTTSGAK